MSSMPTEDEESRPFRCEHPGCSATYRRKEHLTRHAVRHSQSKIFICETCGSSFDRSDTLQRHKKVHKKEEQPVPPRVNKACNRCRAQKSRCDGKLPCSICQKRGAACSFDRDSPRSRKQRQTSIESYRETLSDSNSREHKRRRLNPSIPLEQLSKDEQCLEESPVSDISGRRTELPAPSQPRSARERLLQHEERLQRQGMRLAPADSSVPWYRPDNIFSLNYYSFDNPAGLDEDTTQPIDTPYYVDLYFAHFHPQWPILHERSFQYKHDPIVLVLAVVMFGLWVTGEAKARRQAWKIHARLHTLLKEQMTSWHITEQEQPDTTHKLPMATYQSILLHIIFVLIAGTPSEGEESSEIPLERIRPILTCLIETSLAQGLFYYPAILARGSPDDPIIFAWIRTDEAKRFSLTLFKVSILFSSIAGDDDDRDDTHDQHHRRRGKLSISDLQFPLPDNGFLWGSRPNIHEWWRRRDLRCKNPADTDDRWISDIFADARARGGKAEERRAWLRMGAWLGFLVGIEP